MSKLRVWYDLDGVLVDFEQHFLRWFDLPLHHPKEWNDVRFTENIHRVEDNDLFWISAPKLIEPADILYPVAGYCTARSCKMEIIKKWLHLNGFPDAPIINVGFGGHKGEALKGKCDVMVDDSMTNFKEVNESGVLCFLMTRAHNKTEDVGLFRVDNMSEFMKKIGDMEKMLIKQT